MAKGLFDLPAPLFEYTDGALAIVFPPVIRLIIWGVFAGWLTMLVYRSLSNQKKIAKLKSQQKKQQNIISEFDGRFSELMPIIRDTLGIGFRQLGLALGPALLASIPVLFIIIWVAGAYGHVIPEAGTEVLLTVEPDADNIHWSSRQGVEFTDNGWIVKWPSQAQPLTMSAGAGQRKLLVLPLDQPIPVIHKKKWWNVFMANPLGYLPENGQTDVIHIGLPEPVVLESGPGWMHGWMFSFFLGFLVSSLVFKLMLRVE